MTFLLTSPEVLHTAVDRYFNVCKTDLNDILPTVSPSLSRSSYWIYININSLQSSASPMSGQPRAQQSIKALLLFRRVLY